MGKPKSSPGTGLKPKKAAKPEKIRVKDKMVVDESGWNADSGATVDPEVQKSLLQKLDEFERKKKEKEIEEKRQERQQKIQQTTLFNPNAAPTTKIGKARPLTKKEKEKRLKAAQKAEEFAEQLATKAEKSAQKHARRDKWKGLY